MKVDGPDLRKDKHDISKISEGKRKREKLKEVRYQWMAWVALWVSSHEKD